MDDLHWIWQTIIIFYLGRLLLRIAGRKSVSQMTFTQVVVMVGIGSLLVQPIAGEDITRTLLVGLLITLLMILTEYLEMKFDLVETISTGKAKIVIENGQVDKQQLKKLRMSVDRLETRLRQSGIDAIEDVKHATIEVSGQIGYEQKEQKKPATKEDIDTLLTEIMHMKKAMGLNVQPTTNEKKEENIFTEIKTKESEGENEP